jgi:hypothetical protein
MFMLVLNVDEGDASQLFTVAETERIWSELTTMLPFGLPAIAPFGHWGLRWPTKLASWRSISVRPGRYIVTQAMPWRPALVLLALLG